MKNMIKNKQIFAILAALVLVFTGAPSHALASASFNTDPQDFATVRVSNYTQNPNCYTCWSSTANANAGDIVSVTVYYHNTGNQTATGTFVKLNQPSAASTSFNFSGNVSASNAAAAYGSATINLSSSQTLTFIPGTAVWYPNQTATAQALPFGQSGTEIFGNGINLGNINPGWNAQGSVVLRFQVSSTQALVACNDGIDNDGDGLIDMNDPGCSSSNDTDEYNVITQQQTAPTIITSAATSVGQNSATLNGNFTAGSANTTTWFEYSTNFIALTFNGGTSVGQTSQVLGFGPMSYSLSGLAPGTTYYFRAVGQNSAGTTHGGILSLTTQNVLNYSQAPTITTDYSDNIGSNYATLHGTYNSNNSNTTTWFEYGTSYLTVANGNGTVSNQTNQGTGAGNVSQYISGLQSNTTYYYRAAGQNANGNSDGSVLNFTTSGSNNNSHQAPDISTDYASSIGETYATLHGDYDSNGSNTTTWFEYGTTNSFGHTTSQMNQGTGADSFSKYISGLQSDTTYYFRAVGYNSYGTDYGTTLTFTTSGNVPPPSSNTTALTSLATGVSQANATLNGLISNNSNSSVTAWFEYGTSASLGHTTPSQSLGSGSSMSYLQSVSGLVPNTMYYFRAVAETSAGISTGEIFIFKTLPVSSPVVITVPSPSTPTSSKFVFLKIENRYEAVISGDVIDYTVTYKNISGKTLNKVVVQAVLPKEVKFRKSDKGDFDSSANTLTVNVGTLAIGDEGTVNFQGTATSSIKNKDFILTNALMKYTNPITTAQEEAIAYVLNSVSKNSGSLSAASIFGDGSFLPTTLLGWLMLTLVIFGLIFFGRSLYAQMK